MQKLLLLAALSVSPLVVTAQIDYVEELMEKSAETFTSEHDAMELMEDVVSLSGNPVKINAAKEEDLRMIPYLNAGQRKALYDYIVSFGEILSVFELQSVPGFDSALVKKISPYIVVAPMLHTPPPTLRNLSTLARNDLLLRFDQSFPEPAGYRVPDSLKTLHPGTWYKGHPQRYYFRSSYNWFDKIRMGVAGEKDPGEQFFRGAQPTGMDYYAAYLNLTNLGILKTLVIGNFKVAFGQGLTIGSGISLGTIPGFSVGMPVAAGVHPDLGMSEGSYLRGIAGTLKIKHLQMTGFASYHPRDANILPADSTGERPGQVSSFVTTGYHRTDTEIKKMNALRELVYGGNVTFTTSVSQQFGFRAGITALLAHYSSMLAPKKYPYSIFGFNGNRNLNIGLDFEARYHKLHLFGEACRSMNAGIAMISGATIAPDPRVCLTVVYRNYDPKYENLFAHAFGQNSQNANERGFYIAAGASVHPRLNVSGYADLFTFPWLKYRVDVPTHGFETGLVVSWQATGRMSVAFRFYGKKLLVNAPSEPGNLMHKLVTQNSCDYRFGITWDPDDRIHFNTRIEVKEVKSPPAAPVPGYFICQDIKINPRKWIPEVVFRFALFDVPDYTERIYTAEPEMVFGYSVPSWEGQGMRTCMVLNFKPGRNFGLFIRAGLTRYTDRNKVGTGPDQTSGNLRAELSCQLVLRR